MISLSHKFIFVHVQKTGGNSITRELLDYCEDVTVGDKTDGKKESISLALNDYEVSPDYKHYGIKEYSELLDISDFTTFKVWRPPHKRLPSLWQWGMGGMPKQDEVVERIKGVKSFLSYGPTDYTIDFNHLESGLNEVLQTVGIPKVELGHYNSMGSYEIPDYITEAIYKECEEEYKVMGNTELVC